MDTIENIGNGQPAIDLVGVGVLRDDRWILRDVTWTAPAGACVAILGPNGSGKSTLARVIGGHWWPARGDCTILGQKFGETSLPELRKKIRLVQPAGPYDIDSSLTTEEVVLTGFFGTLALYHKPAARMVDEANALLKLVGLGKVARHAYSTLSSGERVRGLIARALSVKPKLLLLDEPTAGLDVLAREQVLATVQMLFDGDARERPTVVMITHHVEELPPATTQVLLLSEGAVAGAGAPADVLREDVLSRAYGVPVTVRMSGGRYYLEVHPSAWGGLLGR